MPLQHIEYFGVSIAKRHWLMPCGGGGELLFVSMFIHKYYSRTKFRVFQC